MNNVASHIAGSEKLTQIFGQWPSFHDAEVIDVNLWRGRVHPDKGLWEFPVLTVKVHLWKMTREVDSKGYFICENHTLCTLVFREVADLSMTGFNHQNAIFDLEIERKERDRPPSLYFAVRFDPSFGIDSSFECLQIEVADAVPCGDDGTPIQW